MDVTKIALHYRMLIFDKPEPQFFGPDSLGAVKCIVLCVTIFVSSPIKAENWNYFGHQFKTPDPDFKIEKIENAIAYARSLDKVPDLPPDGDSFTDSQQSLPKEITQDFNALEKYFFSKNSQITLYTCDGCVGGMMPEAKSLFLDIDFFNKIKAEYGESAYRQFYQFVIAHELAHFVQDIWTQRHGSSPNNTTGSSGYKEPDKKAPASFNLKQIALSALAHAEVDMIGFKALSDLGYEFPDKGFKVFQELLSKYSGKLGRSYPGFHYHSQFVLRTKVGEYSKELLFDDDKSPRSHNASQY